MTAYNMYHTVIMLGRLCQQENVLIATAESCTGGALAEMITRIPGASKWYTGGIVSYSNYVKMTQLGVPRELIEKNGAVSEQTAIAMVEGLLERSNASLGVAITGIAGPSGSENKSLGTVCLAWANKKPDCIENNTETHTYHFDGDRMMVRKKSCEVALQGLINKLQHIPVQSTVL